jgi:kynurenine formamidase
MDGDMADESSQPVQVGVPDELRQVASEVSNWGKWGPDDELGTLNYITPDHIAHASSLVSSGKTFSLGVAYDAYGPQGAHGFRRNPIHLMTLDGGDIDMIARLGSWGRETEAMISWIWQGPMRFNDDFIMMPLQAATQWDALSHVYYEQKFYNGYDASTCTSMGASKGSIDKPAAAGKVAARGVLLDVAKFKGVDRLEELAIVTPEDLDATAAAQGVEVGQGDVVLVRTGHLTRFFETRDGEHYGISSPGLGWRCGKWLSDKKAAAVACDNLAVETGSEEFSGVLLPMHLLCLRDMGMMLGEMWNFEGLAAECASDGKYEFMLVAAPLQFTGAVGSPLNPIAIK